MKEQAAEAAQKSAVAVVTTVASWQMTKADWSQILSIILTGIMIGWVLTQWGKFILTWWRDEQHRWNKKNGIADTDFTKSEK